MEKNTKTILYVVGGLALAGGIGAAIYFGTRDKTETITGGDTGGGAGSATPPSSGSTIQDVLNNAAIIANQVQAFIQEKFPLRAGMKGPNVKLMQDALRTKFNQLAVKSDGLFGVKTFNALKTIGYVTLVNNTVSKDDFDKIIAGVKKVTT